MAKRNRANHDLKNTTKKTKDGATQTPLKPVLNRGALEGSAVPVPLAAPS